MQLCALYRYSYTHDCLYITCSIKYAQDKNTAVQTHVMQKSTHNIVIYSIHDKYEVPMYLKMIQLVDNR